MIMTESAPLIVMVWSNDQKWNTDRFFEGDWAPKITQNFNKGAEFPAPQPHLSESLVRMNSLRSYEYQVYLIMGTKHVRNMKK